jgi:hypothetical protein
MAHHEFVNNAKVILDTFYESQKSLIEKICVELDNEDRMDELVAKYLDTKIKLKAKKDKNAPKRPANSYLFYRSSVMEKFKNKYPDLSNAERTAKIADKWNKLSDGKKQPFVEQFNEAKKQFEEDKKEYDENL